MSDLPRSNSLVDLAARIKAEHEAAFGHARQALQHAAECGRLLIEAKAQVEHGQWLSWIETNTGVGARQCQKYMRLAEGWAEIGSKCELDSHLSIEGALGLLAAPAKKPSKALAHENPANVRGIVEVRTPQPSNPITSAWDEASDAQRLEFVRDRAEDLDELRANASHARRLPVAGAGSRVRSEKRATGMRLPEDWTLSDADAASARALLPESRIQIEFDKFRDYWRASASPNAVKRDWSAAWRNWCRKAAEIAGDRIDRGRTRRGLTMGEIARGGT